MSAFAHYTKVGDKYKCNYCAREYSASSSGNLAIHLTRCEKFTLELPERRPRKTARKELDGMAGDAKGYTPSTVEMVEYAARKFEEFSMVDDPLWQKILRGKLNRRTFAQATREHASSLKKNFLQCVNGDFFCLTLDSGTNNKRTVDLSVRVRNRSRLWQVVELPVQSAENLEEVCREVVAKFVEKGAIFAGAMSDNAANMVSAVANLCNNFGGLQGTCSCHVLGIVVKAFIAWRDDLEGLVKDCREAALPGIVVPFDQDTRWNNKFLQYQVIASNWEKFVVANVLNATEGRAIHEFFQTILEPLMLHTRICEAEAANIFDSLSAYVFAAPMLVLQVPKTFVKDRLRHFDYPCIAAAATLCPLQNLSLASPFMLHSLKQNCLRIVTNVIKREWDDDEWLRYVSFDQQRAWCTRLNRENTVACFWAAYATEFPMLYAIFDLLWNLPASSADVERVFKAHARICADRPRLGNDGCEAQLVIHTFETAATIPPEHHVKNIDGEVVSKFLDTIATVWKEQAADSLNPGDTVTTYWLKPEQRTRNRWEHWKATLVEKQADGTWKVKWSGRKEAAGSNLTFSPLVDDWLPLK